jgi:CRP/FNR family transcriptional regulator
MRSNGGFSELGLTQAEWQRLAPAIAMQRSVKRGESLIGTGEVVSSLYEVHAGCFKTCSTTEMGREQVTGFHIIGDLVGLEGMGSERQVSESLALEDSLVNGVPFSVLAQLSHESLDLPHRLHQIMSRESERSRRMMVLLASTRAMERVATFLLDLLQRLNARGYSACAVNLCMTREDIGSYLGLTLETVSRMFAKLKQNGVVDLRHRDVRVLDLQALRRAAAGQG